MSEGYKHTAIGPDSLLATQQSLKDRGVVIYFVKVGGLDVPQYRPMTQEELAARDAKHILESSTNDR